MKSPEEDVFFSIPCGEEIMELKTATKPNAEPVTTICTCNHFAPKLRVVRSMPFNTELAAFYAGLGLSGEGVIDWVMTELYDFHTGILSDCAKKPIDLKELDRDGLALLDKVWGEDQGRFINRYLEWLHQVRTNRLKRSVVLPVSILHHARSVYQCRHEGRCSKPAKTD